MLHIQDLFLQTGTEFAIIAAAVIVGLLVLWIIVSVPVWIAAKILTVGRAKFSRAMLVTAIGPIVYGIVFFISNVILTITFGERGFLAALSFLIAFIAWIGVFKKGFSTGWIRALGIAILATIVFAVVGAIITVILNILVPGTPSITPIPVPSLQQA